VGADVEQVRRGVGTDKRIGATFLFPGVGYGGSCFPKDVQALSVTARELGIPFTLLDEVEAINARQKVLLVEKLESAFATIGGLKGRTIALWGLAFKANTDDMREAPALQIIDGLIALGAKVRAHDPVAQERAAEMLEAHLKSGQLSFVPTMYEAAQGADALAIATDWSEYRRPDFDRLASILVRPWVFDGRNMWDLDAMTQRGFVYSSVGRPTTSPASGNAAQGVA
jgi:UDPglucose 6-dehydrogenase